MMRPLHVQDLSEIAWNMRDIQRKALVATTEAMPRDVLARIWDSDFIGASFERDGKLVAVAGAVIIHPGVASTFLYATDDFRKVILEVTRFFKKTLFPTLKQTGIHRVHSLGPANDPEGRRWKEDILGAWPEAHLEAWGKGKEDFVLHSIML